MAKLLIIEDHALVREGLVQTLRQLDAVEVSEVADFDGANALLEQQGCSFDLVLLDLGLPGVDGLTCLKSFRTRYPWMPVVILSAYDDAHTVGKAMKGGAAGFVSKSYSTDRLLSVLREVLSGNVLSPEVSDNKVFVASHHLPTGDGDADPSSFGLTDRQAEVLSLMVRGKSNRDIAALLGLSEGTVKIHLTAIFKRLGVSSRTQAMIVVARRGIRLD